jgi:hypothetical protein
MKMIAAWVVGIAVVMVAGAGVGAEAGQGRNEASEISD